MLSDQPVLHAFDLVPHHEVLGIGQSTTTFLGFLGAASDALIVVGDETQDSLLQGLEAFKMSWKNLAAIFPAY